MPADIKYTAKASMHSIVFRGPGHSAVKTPDRRRIAAGVGWPSDVAEKTAAKPNNNSVDARKARKRSACQRD